MKTALPDGVYLDMPFDQYLALPRLSAGGLTDLMEGPAAFWARSFLNPDRPEETESKAMLHGRAYHCARLEPDEFEKRFARDLVPEDLGDDLLKTATDYGEALSSAGETKKKAGESVLDQARRLREVMPEAKIWHLEREAFEESLDGREIIDPKTWDEIRVDAERLRSNPEVASLIEGGIPEVTILFNLDGVPCKIRPDYMAPGRVVHLKTWDAKAQGKPGNRSIVDTFRFSGHYRTGWFYALGTGAIRDQDLRIRGAADGAELPTKDISKTEAMALSTFFKPAEIATWFLYLRRGGVPDIRARRIRWKHLPPGVDEQAIGASTEGFSPTWTAIARKADLEVSACLRLFSECVEIFGSDPWFPRDMIGTIDDDDFSPFWLDSVEDPR